MAGVARRNDELAHMKSLADIGDGMGHIPSMSRSRVTEATEHSSDKRAYISRRIGLWRLIGSLVPTIPKTVFIMPPPIIGGGALSDDAV